METKNNIVICAVAKNEQEYIKEWVEYHLSIGVDHIYVYDNADSESDALQNVYTNEKLTYIPVFGMEKCQLPCYNDFYNSCDFKWCIFIDVDEFIVLTKWRNIQDMCFDKMFDDVDAIKLNWHIMDDCNIIERNVNEPVISTFTHWAREYKSNSFAKQIVRKGVPNLKINGAHCSQINGKTIKQKQCDGSVSYNDVNGFHDCKEAWINHYRTKSLEEFVTHKLVRCDAITGKRTIDLNYYWMTNKKTPEKIEWLKRKGYLK